MKVSELQVGEAALMFGTLALVRLPQGVLMGSKDTGIKLGSHSQFVDNMDMTIEKVQPVIAIERLELAKPDLAAKFDWEMLMHLDYARTTYVK